MSSRRLCLQLDRAELRGAGLQQLFERLASLVGGAAHGAPFGGRQLRDAAQQLGQLGLAPEMAHAQLPQRIAGCGGGDLPLGLGAQLFDSFAHVGGTLEGGAAGRMAASRGGRAPILSQSPISYSAMVAAIAAFSESVAIGMCATRSH